MSDEEKSWWELAKARSEVFRKGLFPYDYSKEMKKITGQESIWSIEPGKGFDDKGLISIWLAIACLKEEIDFRVEVNGIYLKTALKEISNLKKRIKEAEVFIKPVQKKLTKKQTEAYKLAKEGLTQKEIAQKLGVTQPAVAVLIRNIRKKGIEI